MSEESESLGNTKFRFSLARIVSDVRAGGKITGHIDIKISMWTLPGHRYDSLC